MGPVIWLDTQMHLTKTNIFKNKFLVIDLDFGNLGGKIAK